MPATLSRMGNSALAFVFDMDGVIVDSNPYHEIALRQFCRKYGRDLSEEELREKIFGRRNRDWLTRVFGDLSEEEIKKYGEEKEALFRQLYEKDIQPVAGLKEFLDEVAKLGIPRCIATSAPRANVDFVLDKTGLGRYFEVVLDESFVKEGKPHPEVYLKAARALNFPPDRAIVFEDSLAGVEAARAAGCPVIGVTTTHTAEELTHTDLVIDDFTGIDPGSLLSRFLTRDRSDG